MGADFVHADAIRRTDGAAQTGGVRSARVGRCLPADEEAAARQHVIQFRQSETLSVPSAIIGTFEEVPMAGVEAYQTAHGRRYRVRYRKPDRTQTDKRGFRTRRDAELFLASIEVSIARGEFVDAGAARATIGELGGSWIRNQTHLKPSLENAREHLASTCRTPLGCGRRVSDPPQRGAELGERHHRARAERLDGASRVRDSRRHPRHGCQGSTRPL